MNVIEVARSLRPMTFHKSELMTVYAFSIGDWVRHSAPDGHDNYPVGRVVGIERYTDFAGTRDIYEVRFIDPNGVVDKEPKRFRAQELVAVEKK